MCVCIDSVVVWCCISREEEREREKREKEEEY